MQSSVNGLNVYSFKYDNIWSDLGSSSFEQRNSPEAENYKDNGKPPDRR